MFDLHDSEENSKLGSNLTFEHLDSKKKIKIGEVKKAAKRKFVSELVNPNAKRRKNRGAKYDDEDDTVKLDITAKVKDYKQSSDEDNLSHDKDK